VAPLAAFTLALGAGCSAFHPALEGQERFLCCNLFFNRDRDATDANYVYTSGRMLPVGTAVHVREVGSSYVGLQPSEGTAIVYLEHVYGRDDLTTREYFDRILLTSDPAPALQQLSAEVAAAVRVGHVIRGMTRDEVLLARGYPPGHQTPGLSAAECHRSPARGRLPHDSVDICMHHPYACMHEGADDPGS